MSKLLPPKNYIVLVHKKSCENCRYFQWAENPYDGSFCQREYTVEEFKAGLKQNEKANTTLLFRDPNAREQFAFIESKATYAMMYNYDDCVGLCDGWKLKEK